VAPLCIPILHFVHGSLSLRSNGISIGLAFLQGSPLCAQHTDTKTTERAISVATGRICVMLAMGPNRELNETVPKLKDTLTFS